MTESKTVLVIIGSALVVARFAALGFIISKHGQEKKPKKTEKYNAITHAIWTAFAAWVVYELYN